MPHPLATAVALVFAIFGSGISLYTFVNPLFAARLHISGPITTSKGTPLDATSLHFVTVFGGRTLAIGTAIFAFWWQGMEKAMGILLICSCIGGTVDTVVAGRARVGGKAWEHAAGTVGLGLVGWGLVV